MNREIQTDQAPASFSNYSQGMEIPAGASILHISGQVGAQPDGTLVGSAEGQMEIAWQNVFAILGAANMSKEDIVDVLAIVPNQEDVGLYRKVRDSMLGEHRACSTLLVCGLADPEWRVEIAVKAAKIGEAAIGA